MTTIPSTDIASAPSEIARPKLDHPMGIRTILIFFAIIVLGLFFTAYSIHKNLTAAGTPVTSYLHFLLLGVALLIALGFEFVNGFHDTANAVATVIYTHSPAPPIAVVWSGCSNFLGVLFSTGAVAFGIVSLLPVELIMQVGSEAGYAMVLAMLIAAIIWNLGTWWLGPPASSSHILIGSIIGVGVAKRLCAGVTERRGSIAAPQIHGTELEPKTTHIVKPRQSAQSGDKRRNLYLPVNGVAIGVGYVQFPIMSSISR
jgi:inorganic phosphate transporter, PiT family